MRPLYAIRSDVLALNDLIEEIEGDLSRAGEMETALHAWLAGLEQEQAEKLDAYVNLVRTLRNEATAAKAEKEQWAAKEKARTNRADYLERLLKEHLEATGQPKVTTASGRTVAVVGNGGVRPVLFEPVIDLDEMPADCLRVRREPDREAIREKLEAGETVPFAKLGERGTRLVVR